MAENLRSRKRKHEEKRDWTVLPSQILGRIFSFLSRKDRTNMSLVCNRWSEGFESPEVWKVFKVSYSDFFVDSPVMKFAKRFSNKFKHVEIQCDFVSDTDFSWCNSLKTLLETLATESILYSIKLVWHFVYMDTYNRRRYRNLYELFVKMLFSQKHLKRLELHRFHLTYRDGINLLKRAIEGSGDSLKYFNLREFVNNCSILNEQDLGNPFQLPNSSRYLKIDYCLLFGIRDATLSHANKILQNCHGELILDIFVEGNTLRCIEGFEMMPPSEWRNLKQRFPGLGVQLYVSLAVNRQRYPPTLFIVEDMPITRLAYHFMETPPPFADFLQLLRSCRVNNHLESLDLRWPDDIADIDTTFNPFLTGCRKLKVLKLETVHPTNKDQLISFLQNLFVNHPESLVEFSLRLNCRGRNWFTCLDGLKPLFKSVNIDFKPSVFGLGR